MRPARASLVCAVLSLLGIGIAGYLVYLHLGLLRGELLGGAVCGGGHGPMNCHAVTDGSWGQLLGMPLAFWGILSYVAVLALAVLARQSKEWETRALTLIAALAALFVLFDLRLFFLMVFVIRYYCVFCLATYAVNLLLLGVAWSAVRRAPIQEQGLGRAISAVMPSSRRPATWLFWGVLLTGTAGVVGTHAATMFVLEGGGNIKQQMRDFIAKQPRVSIETAGDPALGPKTAPIQVVEFSDFLCPACQRASKFNTIILASHRRDVRFIFKNYPLDTTCNSRINRVVHSGACQVAAASECALLQGKFWPFHDLVFEQGHDYKLTDLEADAGRLGLDVERFRACLSSGEGMEAVKRDIAEGGKANVMSTPTYIINGIPTPGGLSPTRFDDFVALLNEASR